MVSYGFSKDAMLLELRSILMAEANIAGRFFNPAAARAMFGLEPGNEPVRFEDLDIGDLHISRVLSLLYDLVMNAEWDMFGGLFQPFSMRVDAIGFVERARAAVNWEMEFQEFALGGEHGAVENGMCAHIAKAAAGRIQLFDPEEYGYEIGIEELAELAHVDVRTVRNAGKELDIRWDAVQVDQAKEWLTSRRMYRETRVFDSIDSIDARGFLRLGELLVFVVDRCIERGIDDASVFKERVGWLPDELIPESKQENPLAPFAHEGGFLHFFGETSEQPVDLTKALDAASWQRVAELIDVDWIWLFARVLRTGEVGFKSHTIAAWYERTVWQLWDAFRATRTGRTILVPVASDGTWFHAGLARSKGFLIGGKKDQSYITDFTAALDALKAMPHAYWHRPNPTTGRWGVVKALSWKEMPETQVMGKHAEHKP